MPSAWILGQFGGATQIVTTPPVDELHYTDETQMMIAISPNSWPTAIARALGDDVDTLTAMTGALSGAHLGAEALSPHILTRIENETKGRDYIRTLSQNLHNSLPQ